MGWSRLTQRLAVARHIQDSARAWREDQTQLQLVDDLIQRGFGGSAMKLVLSAVSAKRVKADELAALKELLKG